MAKQKLKKVGKAFKKAGADYYSGTSRTIGNVVNAVESAIDGKPIKAIRHAAKAVSEVAKTGVNSIKNTGKFLKTLVNHPEWYGNYPLDGLVTANFGRRKGVPESGYTPFSDAGGKMSIPNVAGIHLALTIPNDQTGAYKQAINIMYNRIRRANAGAINYEPQDLAQYVDAVNNLHAGYFVLRKAYGTLFNFSAFDSTIPATIFAAMGLDYDTFKGNAGSLRSYLQILSTQLKESAPLKIDLLNRTDWLFSNHFADSDDAKHSMYTFRLDTLRSYNRESNGTTTIVNSSIANNISSTVTGAEYDSVIESMNITMENFRNNYKFQIIAGDLLKAYGPDIMFDNVTWGPNEMTPVVYDENALTQIQNALVFGTNYSISNTVELADGWPKSNIVLTRGAAPSDVQIGNLADLVSSPFINTYKDNLSSTEVISSTRFTVGFSTRDVATLASASSDEGQLFNGTEICTEMRVYYVTLNSTSMYRLNYGALGIRLLSDTIDPVVTRCWSAMDWAPFTMIMNAIRTNAFIEVQMFDFNNYARLSGRDISDYHAFATLSLLHIPELLKTSNAVKI